MDINQACELLVGSKHLAEEKLSKYRDWQDLRGKRVHFTKKVKAKDIINYFIVPKLGIVIDSCHDCYVCWYLDGKYLNPDFFRMEKILSSWQMGKIQSFDLHYVPTRSSIPFDETKRFCILV